jgi:hypothetical protein
MADARNRDERENRGDNHQDRRRIDQRQQQLPQGASTTARKSHRHRARPWLPPVISDASSLIAWCGGGRDRQAKFERAGHLLAEREIANPPIDVPAGYCESAALRVQELDQVGLVIGKPLPSSLELLHAVPAVLAFSCIS